MPTLVLLLALIFLVPFISPGQQRCPVVPTEQESKIFEDWLRQKMEAKRLLFKTYEALSTAQEVYTIPVVVHVIHNGEAQGDGTNISNAQIFSQIDVLNEDFRRLNADTINTPSIFQSVVADAEIQFELAKRDPEGLPTNGIVRVQGSQAEWDFGDEDDLKAQSYWPANDYLNMWVANLKSPLLGFATFPISDLQGLENEFTNNELLDGVVTGHRFFGSIDKGDFEVLASPFNLGRTTTHEVGHFLGLRHVWGDGGCGLDDFCDDTPRAEDEHISCPTTDLITCGSRDMYENYLDFTEDSCMNIFTFCQRGRMRAVLENSPRRKSLLASNALVAPTLVSNNMGIRNIISPVSNICVANFIPGVEVRNYGTNTVTSFRVRVSLDGQTVETLNVSGSLDPLDIANITFLDINLGNPGTHKVSYEIINTNGQTDQVASNNLAEIDVVFAAQGFSTITEQFESLPNDWFVSNPDDSLTWSITSAPGNGINNKAIYMNSFNYGTNGIGQLDFLFSPVFEFAGVIFAEVSFKVAYAHVSGGFPEGLILAITTDCSNNFSESIIFQKYGNTLATASSNNEFIPSDKSEWRTETINLSKFSGSQNVQVVFISQSGAGNNLYIDDITIRVEREFNLKILEPPTVTCENLITPQIEFINPIGEDINSLRLEYTIGNQPQESVNISDLEILPGRLGLVDLPPINLEDGEYTLTIDIVDLNGKPVSLENSSEATTFRIDNQTDQLPLREKFEVNFLEEINWTTVPNNDTLNWELVEALGNGNGNKALLVPQFNSNNTGKKNWLVSPILDFSQLLEASLFFKVSYASNPNSIDTLEVIVLEDCGKTVAGLLYQKSGEELGDTILVDIEWLPQQTSDWRTEFIDLGGLIGRSDLRIALISTDGGGNNLFIDDIEFFLSSDPNPAEVPDNNFIIFPNPTLTNEFKISFNLPQKEDLSLLLFSPTGHIISTVELPNTLNQTYTYDFLNQPNGIYFLRIVGKSFVKTKRVGINQ